MPQVAFTTLGCKVNQFETEIMEGLFKQRGYEIVPFDQVADVYVINTCSVTHLGEKKSRQIIRRAIRLNPKAIVAVAGCYAQVSPKEIEAIEGVKVIVGTQDRQRIVDLVEKAAHCMNPVNVVANIMDAEHFEDIPLFEAPGRTRAFLKIQEGCTNFCTYCIIPYARGPLRSRPLSSIIQETEKLIAAGFKEIVLTGIHLGAYGRDVEEKITLADVVKAILNIKGLVRLRLGSLESIEISDELIGLIKQDERLCSHLHLPLQAGDTAILKAMNRHYGLDEYQRLITNIRNKVEDIAISTDIIVGFPGETPEMFNNALTFVEKMNFSRMHIFPYSRRSGTPAAEYSGQIPEEEKKRRVQIMQELAERKADEFLQSFLNRKFTVLFEMENQKNEHIIDGLTGNYIRVYTNGNQSMQGQSFQVVLEKPYRDGVWGKIVD
ncbi:tRNA (N(6)-L-threonylcarbamoyladenosine(37)-C(2))-methylthiotransferase MtaB [Pelosinus propionicus]|uniref:Threonylcarbamoyladenosine tRNA methylthiotransferase MtaB n=1 Tax=Pelosinus propionicus DSM 13327 TaxID=1123291 RepID=A0A1I4GQB4_9FIRM|nr:tRNA (N(6)-L-threonylcarbamoyladenosine(37)-C(2))-methylthiotransferase MtaB [Pelosinus propionicus]SFL32224.1 threonylcarbamoyladenosine tRNA methylthiotransferase MtaB [Pelosinus propionicus DSM 13327]